ncbi:DUF4177 domain-containing protein [Paracoccus aminophilus]|uniref:DUF4177 domain-containing protein n=1 Tax=Paracoccus aminophilus JCM 7686 TaxID=1367847 RepID=S5XS61_PARAH|nr:DUF4177 domain-containing protein [Paracoccus aminophilus]AGT07957.1 hypothetical protein JCM7686_0848 [Paracoccus aminophilus JCM 7686]
MQKFEYSVIPAPDRGEKARGAKTGADRFSLALTTVLNERAAEGWEYVRAETLPAEERTGLTGRATVYHNVLIFRRALAGSAPQEVESRLFSQPMRVIEKPEPQREAIAEAEAADEEAAAAEAGKA